MTETPEYIVLKKQNNFEIRKYPEMIKAEVQVAESDYKSAAEKGFRILAGYIFGNNTSREKVEMTTPVHVASSQQIAMTTPVTITGGDKFTVAFIMPAVYTIETLPIPGDQSIRFNVVPEQQMSATRFSGYFKKETIEKHKELLRQWLDQLDLKTEGDFIIAGYNPPWVPGFLSRTEILIKITTIPDPS